MESAIDKHLKCPRTLSRRVADDFKPPFPMYVARANPDLKQVAMAYLGVQYLGEQKRQQALSSLRDIVEQFATEDGPGHYDLTQHRDADGYDNLIAVA
jgi:aldoxime dehydratase